MKTPSAELMTECERRVNRSSTFAALWVAAAVALVCLVGVLTEMLVISCEWMCFYAGALLLPLLAIAAYAKARDYRGHEVKYLLVGAAALVPAALSVPTVMGFLMMPLPIVAAGRYFSRSFVWKVYLLTLALVFVLTVPHVRFGTPSYPLCDEARNTLVAFLDGKFNPIVYWRYLVVYCFPSFAICLSIFAIAMCRLCTEHLDMLARQMESDARLADMEKALVLAAAAQVSSCLCDTRGVRAPADGGRSQPDVRDWSMQAIADCIAKVKCRAAEDPVFAELVELDPAAAVKEVQT